jgi:hypothetical protein
MMLSASPGSIQLHNRATSFSASLEHVSYHSATTRDRLLNAGGLYPQQERAVFHVD